MKMMMVLNEPGPGKTLTVQRVMGSAAQLDASDFERNALFYGMMRISQRLFFPQDDRVLKFCHFREGQSSFDFHLYRLK